MPAITSPEVAEIPATRKTEPVQFRALGASVHIPSDDPQSWVLTARTHCGQAVAVRMTRRMLREICGDVVAREGLRLVHPTTRVLGGQA